jgi:hypothetical protein
MKKSRSENNPNSNEPFFSTGYKSNPINSIVWSSGRSISYQFYFVEYVIEFETQVSIENEGNILTVGYDQLGYGTTTITAYDEIYLTSPPVFLPPAPLGNQIFGSQIEASILDVSINSITFSIGGTMINVKNSDENMISTTKTIRITRKDKKIGKQLFGYGVVVGGFSNALTLMQFASTIIQTGLRNTNWGEMIP